MRLVRRSACVAALFVCWTGSSHAEGRDEAGPEGFYLKVGIAGVASTSYDVANQILAFLSTTPESSAMVGFQTVGGYRWADWVGTDVELVYGGGGEVTISGVKVSSSSALAVAAVARVYPIEWFRAPGRRSVEWALDLGVGGGRFFEDTAIPLAESSLLVRVGTGLDLWHGDNFGLYVDGGYFVATRSGVNGFGFAAVGGAYRF